METIWSIEKLIGNIKDINTFNQLFAKYEFKKHCRVIRYSLPLRAYVWKVPMPTATFKRAQVNIPGEPIATVVDYFINNETTEAMNVLTNDKDKDTLIDPEDFLRDVSTLAAS